jgi:hypothetical protein
MSNIKAIRVTSTNVSWQDEVTYSHDLKFEGFEKLKEALKQAKASGGDTQSESSSPSEDEPK